MFMEGRSAVAFMYTKIVVGGRKCIIKTKQNYI